MDIELNKIAGAAPGTLLFTMVLGISADAVYAPRKLEKPGYDLPALAEAPSGGVQATEAAAPLPVRLAQGRYEKGRGVVQGLHGLSYVRKGWRSESRPPLYGVVGRAKASIANSPIRTR